MGKRAVVFDLDGTLVDSSADLTDAINAVRGQRGFAALSQAAVAGHVGDGLGQLLERTLPDVAADPGLLPAARTQFETHYARHCCDHTAAYDGVDELLRRLQAVGWRLGVATNKPVAFARDIIAHCGWTGLIGALVGGDHFRKPDPTGVQQVLEELGASAGDAWMVGDHRTDIRAGHAAGCRVVWCTWGIGRREDLPVDAVIDHPLALLAVLAGEPGLE